MVLTNQYFYISNWKQKPILVNPNIIQARQIFGKKGIPKLFYNKRFKKTALVNYDNNQDYYI